MESIPARGVVDRLTVLLAEDDPAHAEAIRRALEHGPSPVDLRVVPSVREFKAAIATRIPDVAVIDLNLADGRAESLLAAPVGAGGFPVMVMTSHGDEETAVAAMKAGALDYVVKSEEAFSLMPQSIQRVRREWLLRKDGESTVQALRDREARYRAVTETAADGFWMTDFEGRILDVNEAYVRRSGYSRDELLTMRISDLEAAESPAATTEHMQLLRRRGADIFESRHRAKDGTVWQVEIDTAIWPIEGGRAFVWIRDLAGRKRSEYLMRVRAQIVSAASERSVDDLLQCALDEMELMTGSAIGFFHFVDADQEHLRLQTWSTNTLRSMCTAEGKGQHYPVSKAGVWVDCLRDRRPIIHNDYASLPNRKGMPEGHAVVTREVVVPVMSGGVVTAIAGVGNKTTDYVQADVEAIEAITAMVVDLALRKQAQAEFEHFFQLVPDMVCIASFDGHFQRINSRWTQTLGYSLAELMAEPFISFVHPDDREATIRVFDAERMQGTPASEFVNRYRAKDGSYRWLEWNARPIDDQKLVFAAARDITARKEAEAALRRSKQWMELHVQRTPLAVIEWDTAFTVAEWNPAAEQLFGWTRGEALGRHYAFIVPDAERPAVDETGSNLMAQRGGARSTNQNITKDGRVIDCDWFNTTLVDETGKVIGVASLVQDVTARHALEAQLRQAQKLEAVGQLAGGVAHDYNNILAATMMNLGLLQERTDVSGDVRQTVEDLSKLAERSAALTRQLLMFSRRSVLTIRTLDLNQVLRELSKMLHRLIGEHIALTFIPAPALPSIQADSGMIEQIATNLCVNARDAMPKGGAIRMTTSAVTVDAVRAQAHPEARVGRFVCLAVTDTGTGMTPDVVQRVFEPFFTTKEQGKGTGLGLATVFGIAKQHNGWVEVDSTLGAGSTFRVYLPADPSATVTPDEPRKTPAKGGRETILLVEDDEPVRKTVALVLQRYGYRVITASNGPEAIERWEAERASVALVYTDMVMPGGITGLELVVRLRAERPDLKAIISSGYSADLASAKSLAEHDVLFLGKPVPADDLATAIRNRLDGVDKA